jgi:glycosyltransferase involved in cell wall biosynthesis
LNDIITVNDSIAQLYNDEYGKALIVVRNIPSLQKNIEIRSKKELGMNDDKFILLLQGSGINIDRGAEEAVMAMRYIDNAVFYIIGDGDVIGILKKMVKDNNLEQRVVFIPKQPMDRLLQYTVYADLGLTLDKDTNINYRFSLPNKLFDYIHAGVPVLASSLVEVKKIVRQYDVGEIIDDHKPEHIAEKINHLIADKERMRNLKENCNIAALKLNWEIEESKLINVFKKYV